MGKNERVNSNERRAMREKGRRRKEELGDDGN